MGFLPILRCRDLAVDYLGRLIILIALSLGATFISIDSARADDGTWSIVETKGDVQVLRAGFQPIALTEGVTLHPGDRIVTARTGRAILTSGEDTIIVAPNSEMGLPALKRPGWGTRIIQELGTIFLKVESAAERRFEVETPVLAAVVKGTRFTVTANPLGAAVHVLEGAVEVSAFASQQTGLVMPGQTARLDSSPGSRLEIDGNEAPRGGESESFERTLETEEPEVEETLSPVATEIEQAAATGDLGASETRVEASAPLVKAVKVVAKIASDEQAAAAGRGVVAVEDGDKGPAPKVIPVALGNTDINLRQVTRGLVRNEIAANDAAGRNKQDKSEQAAKRLKKAEAKKAKRVAKAAAAKGTEGLKRTVLALDDDDNNSVGGLADVGETPDREAFTEKLELSSVAAPPAGLGSLPTEVGDDTGSLSAKLDNDDAAAPTGVGSGAAPTSIASLGDLETNDRAAPALDEDAGVPTGIGSDVVASIGDSLSDIDDGGRAAPDLGDETGIPTGIGLDSLPSNGGLSGDLGGGGDFGSDSGVDDGATGIGDLPSGLSDLAGLPSGLGDDDGAPDDAVDLDDIEDAKETIQEVQKELGGAKALKLSRD